MKVREIREKYPYLYETHLHTREASACAKNSAQEMVQAAKDYGLSLIHIYILIKMIDKMKPSEE